MGSPEALGSTKMRRFKAKLASWGKICLCQTCSCIMSFRPSDPELPELFTIVLLLAFCLQFSPERIGRLKRSGGIIGSAVSLGSGKDKRLRIVKRSRRRKLLSLSMCDY